jgi:hypothetical protein
MLLLSESWLRGRLALLLASGQGRASPPAGYQHVRQNRRGVALHYIVPSLLVLASAFSPFADVEAPIDFATKAEVYFSRFDTTDTVGVTIHGKSCADAVFTVSITAHGGKEIYRKEIPLETFIPCEYAGQFPEATKMIPVRLVNSPLDAIDAGQLHCRCLNPPCFGGCWEHPELPRLRKLHRPALCYPTTSESSTCVVFDPGEKTVVEVFKKGH